MRACDRDFREAFIRKFDGLCCGDQNALCGRRSSGSGSKSQSRVLMTLCRSFGFQMKVVLFSQTASQPLVCLKSISCSYVPFVALISTIQIDLPIVHIRGIGVDYCSDCEGQIAAPSDGDNSLRPNRTTDVAGRFYLLKPRCFAGEIFHG